MHVRPVAGERPGLFGCCNIRAFASSYLKHCTPLRNRSDGSPPVCGCSRLQSSDRLAPCDSRGQIRRNFLPDDARQIRELSTARMAAWPERYLRERLPRHRQSAARTEPLRRRINRRGERGPCVSGLVRDTGRERGGLTRRPPNLNRGGLAESGLLPAPCPLMPKACESPPAKLF